MHFRDSNYKVIRMHQREKQQIKEQKLILCWWKYKTSETPGLANWWLCSSMFGSWRVGERPHGSHSQPALLFAQINFYSNWRHFTCRSRKATKCIKSTSDKIIKQRNNITRRSEKYACIQGVGWATVEVKNVWEERGIKTTYRKMISMWKKINEIFGKIAGRIYIALQMN